MAKWAEHKMIVTVKADPKFSYKEVKKSLMFKLPGYGTLPLRYGGPMAMKPVIGVPKIKKYRA